MENYHNLLIEATKKLICLSSITDFKSEFLFRAPPVLWFGNNSNDKEKILTLGANPSREEFLAEDKHKTAERLKKQKLPIYLGNTERRFKHLEENQNWSDIINNKSLRNDIIKSYNDYFINKPYKWFGKEKENDELSYNVEGFINCFGSSFYEGDQKFQSIHIDLFPFSTVSDFKSILEQAEEYIFKDNWTKNFLDNLIHEIKPNKIIIFGRTNLKYFTQLTGVLDKGEEYRFSATTKNGKNSKASYWCFKYKNITIIGLSANLGNPQGFSKVTLNSFGNTVNKFVNKRFE